MGRKRIPLEKIICKTCGKEFWARPCDKRKFCSLECSRASWKNSRNRSILSKCVICNKEFYRWPSRIKDGKDKCCSRKCATELMKTTSYLIKNNPSKTEEGKKRISEAHRGAKNFWWKGGISPLRYQIYRSDIFRNWRREVFKRDNWTCQECGTVGGELQAHHIKPFSDILKENNIKTLEDALKCKELGDINNGITLCKECHKLTDSYGWKNQFRNK